MSQMGAYTTSGVFPPGSVVQTLTGNSGGPVGPDGLNNINVVGDTVTTTIAGNALSNTLTVSVTPNFASTYTTDDTNFAVPVAYNLNIVGAGGITTTSAGDTVTIHAGASGIITINGDTGSVTGNPITLETNVAASNANGTMNFSGAGATMTLNVSDGFSNVGMGQNCFKNANPGNNSVALGNQALQFSGPGAADNVAIGQSAGNGAFSSMTGHGNIFIGTSASSGLAGTESNNIFLNDTGVSGDTAVLRIQTSVTAVSTGLTKAFIGGIDGVDVGSTAKVVTMGTGATVDQLGTATITAGTGISITPAANTITIASSVSSIAWSVITADQTAVVNNGYFCNKAGTLALALPAASVVGDIIEVSNINTATGVQFTQAAGQQIFIGNTNTTLGATGTLTSSAVGDALKIVCSAANTTWRTVSSMGNWTPA